MSGRMNLAMRKLCTVVKSHSCQLSALRVEDNKYTVIVIVLTN